MAVPLLREKKRQLSSGAATRCLDVLCGNRYESDVWIAVDSQARCLQGESDTEFPPKVWKVGVYETFVLFGSGEPFGELWKKVASIWGDVNWWRTAVSLPEVL